MAEANQLHGERLAIEFGCLESSQSVDTGEDAAGVSRHYSIIQADSTSDFPFR
jgi:hypothetical protein